MRWQGRRQSTNIEDRRGQAPSGGIGRSRIPFNIPIGRGGGGGLGRASGGGIGIIVIAVVAMLIFGINPLELLGGGTSSQIAGSQPQGELGAPDDERGQFVATILADSEDIWTEIFRQQGADYPEPTLVMFSGATTSACGAADAGMGPFYCPADQKVYIDLAFYDELRTQFGAPGDFAEAYVVAHEIGHHVQNVLGTLDGGAAARGGRNSNETSVRTELQADCFAGIYANRSDRLDILDDGDIDEALNAAAAIGDDAIQRRTQGYVVPETFNHGSSQQRATWFRRGYETGSVAACDTFAGRI